MSGLLVLDQSCAAHDTISGSFHADTVFVEDFESGTLAAWADGVDPGRQRVVTDPTVAQSGSRYLDVTYPAGGDGGWLTRFFMPGYDSLYVSYYVRFPADWQGGTKLLGLYGSRTDDQWSAFGKAGICPDGTDFFIAMVVAEPAGNPGATRFFTYYRAMAREPDGVTCWGRYGDGSETYVPPLVLTPGLWHHLEFWVKLNAPGQSNATQTLWIDGVQRGTWSGLSLRDSDVLRLNAVQLTFNRGIGGGPVAQRLYVDHLVVTTARPMR
jgi:polysaccharide lyase-like protein